MIWIGNNNLIQLEVSIKMGNICGNPQSTTVNTIDGLSEKDRSMRKVSAPKLARLSFSLQISQTSPSKLELEE